MYKRDIDILEHKYFTVFKTLDLASYIRTTTKVVLITFVVFPIMLLLVKWQQTSFGVGSVMVPDPNYRPQKITALVPGRISKWYIQEGMYVNKGDKLVEIIDNDTNIIESLEEQLTNAKSQYEASQNATNIAKINLDRQKTLYEKGVVARKEYEAASINFQNYNGKASTERVKIAEMNIKIARQKSQTIYAPGNGQIVHVKSGGMATTIKSGETIATFLPESNDFAIELMIDPSDMPLVEIGDKVRIQFDGWPIIQFSGWPSVAIGTFGGIVKVIDGYLQDNGGLRVIIIQDPDSKNPWPSRRFLRAGVKVKAWILLRRVTIGYEIWRKINKFPKNREHKTWTAFDRQTSNNDISDNGKDYWYDDEYNDEQDDKKSKQKSKDSDVQLSD